MHSADPSPNNEVELIPGTVHLVDAQGTMHSKHAKGMEKDIVLVPEPSSSPDDPLNWSQRRKLMSAFCMAVYVLVIGICSSSLYSILDPFSKSTGLSHNVINSGTGYMFLFLGFGCIFWQAIAVQYGKRPVYLISTAATLGIMMWQPYIRDNGEWYAAKILQGFFGAPIESLAEITISDVFFTHERGKYIALYALALGYSNGIAPLITGFINDGQSFHWVFYWCAIFCGLLLILIFFCMEETKFDRVPHVNAQQSQDHFQGSDKEATPSKTHPNGAQETGDQQVEGLENYPTNISVARTVDTQATKKSRVARLKVIERENLRGENHLLRLMWRPLLLIVFPIIAYAGFIYGTNFIWLAMFNAMESIALSEHPYSMSTSILGVTFIAPLIGTTIACVYTGIFGDKFIIKMARRNKGFMEAEHRLWLFVPSLLLIPAGCIMFGVGVAHHIHWFGVVFAMGIISFTSTAGAQIAIAYCIDCYRDLGGEALASVIVIRNCLAFGFGYAVTPWVENMGYQNAFILAGFLGVAHNLTIFPIIRWGRNLRQRSANRYWSYAASGRALGLNH